MKEVSVRYHYISSRGQLADPPIRIRILLQSVNLVTHTKQSYYKKNPNFIILLCRFTFSFTELFLCRYPMYEVNLMNQLPLLPHFSRIYEFNFCAISFSLVFVWPSYVLTSEKNKRRPSIDIVPTKIRGEGFLHRLLICY